MTMMMMTMVIMRCVGGGGWSGGGERGGGGGRDKRQTSLHLTFRKRHVRKPDPSLFHMFVIKSPENENEDGNKVGS